VWTTRGGGHLLLTAGLAVSHALEVPAPLAAAHGALPALARTLSQHHGRCGVRVNVVAFGDLSGGHGSALPDAAARRADLERHAATRSRSTADEAARFVAWAAFAPHLSGAVSSLHGGL
jgi:NAD(P)-dependent dehydrogenase (short-subunit alcohol dehydrogenase family)